MNNAADDLPPDGSPEEQDALRSIGDIGPRYAEALHQIGVHTPADLARYTPELLAQELRDKAGVRVTPDRIRAKDWIGQAQSLSENAPLSQEADAESAIANNPGEQDMPVDQNSASQRSQAALDQSQSELHAQFAEWRERGMFTIRFIEGVNPNGAQAWQIRVYHEGGSGPEMPFNGLDPNPWVQWIFAQMELPGQTVEPLAAEEQWNGAVQTDTVEETLWEQADSELPSLDVRPYENEETTVAFDAVDVNAWPPAPERFLVVEARFHFEGEHAREMAQERAPFHLDFYLIDLISQESRQIGSSEGQMESDRDLYELQLNFAMPAPGQYELQTIAQLPQQNIRAFRDGPTFHVVAAEEPSSSI